MSGFFLCWHRDGAAVEAELARVARRVFARDARRTVGESAGAGWLAFHAAAPDGSTSEGLLPRHERGWAGSGVVRLDDRASLDARLRDNGMPGETDDVSLAWRSLAAWGDAAPTQWAGDYAIAALAPARDRLVVARGTFGVRSCFVATIGALECVSDDLALLAHLPGVDASRDARAIDEFLRAGELVTPGLTFMRGIVRVPASHTLLIARDGSRRVMRHWEFPVPPLRHGASTAELGEELRELLGRAMEDRLRAPRTTLLLSGGLDSPALAAAATRVPSRSALGALTVSWARLLPDEESRWAGVAANATGLPLTELSMDPDVGLRFDHQYVTPEPVTDAEPAVWRATAASLAALGPVALLGEDVDALLSPPTLGEQLRLDGWRRTARDWLSYRRSTGRRPWTGLRRGLRAMIGRGVAVANGEAPAWLRAPDRRARSKGVDATARHPTRADAVRSLSQPTWEALWWQNEPAASGADVRVLFPYLDPRVIRFFFSLPPVPWLQQKRILREAFVGSLPGELLARPKSSLAGYYEERVRRWRALGAPAPLPAPVDEWVDVARWRSALATETDPDRVLAAWRVLELSRWLAQPGSP